MDDIRTRLLLGDELSQLQLNTIAVVGLGRVGSYMLETLSRIGFKRFIVIDSGVLSDNFNALYSGENISKAEAAKKRIDDINEDAEVIAYSTPYNKNMLKSADIIANTLPAPYCFNVMRDAKEMGINIITGYNLKFGYDPKEIKLKKLKQITSVFPELIPLDKEGFSNEKILFSEQKEDKIYYPSLSGLVFSAELVGALIAAKSKS